MDRVADDGKLGQGFTSADDLVEIDIGSGDNPRPTFMGQLCNCPYSEAQFLVCPYFLNFARLPLFLQDESTVCPSFLYPLVGETFRPKKKD